MNPCLRVSEHTGTQLTCSHWANTFFTQCSPPPLPDLHFNCLSSSQDCLLLPSLSWVGPLALLRIPDFVLLRAENINGHCLDVLKQAVTG
jgi:hypothetical protein